MSAMQMIRPVYSSVLILFGTLMLWVWAWGSMQTSIHLSCRESFAVTTLVVPHHFCGLPTVGNACFWSIQECSMCLHLRICLPSKGQKLCRIAGDYGGFQHWCCLCWEVIPCFPASWLLLSRASLVLWRLVVKDLYFADNKSFMLPWTLNMHRCKLNLYSIAWWPGNWSELTSGVAAMEQGMNTAYWAHQISGDFSHSNPQLITFLLYPYLTNII